MNLKEQLTPEETPEGQLTKAEEQDLTIMVALAQNMIDDSGIDVIKSAEKSKDQGQVIGQFMFQLGSQLAEKLSGMVDVSPRIMLVEGGWAEQVSDYLQEEYQIPKNIMDRAELYIGGMAQEMAAAQQGGGAPAGAAPAQPAGPEQQMPPMPMPGGM